MMRGQWRDAGKYQIVWKLKWLLLVRCGATTNVSFVGRSGIHIHHVSNKSLQSDSCVTAFIAVNKIRGYFFSDCIYYYNLVSNFVKIK